MNHLKKLLPLLLIFLVFTSFRFIKQNDCKILHEGTFLYDGVKENDIVVKIKGDDHIELHNGGKYKIESKLEWVDDCEYNMTMIKNTVPNFPFQPGDVMNVKVNKIEGDVIYYTATVKNKSYKGVLRKIK